jgi:hypothetical protein
MIVVCGGKYFDKTIIPADTPTADPIVAMSDPDVVVKVVCTIGRSAIGTP